MRVVLEWILCRACWGQVQEHITDDLDFMGRDDDVRAALSSPDIRGEAKGQLNTPGADLTALVYMRVHTLIQTQC